MEQNPPPPEEEPTSELADIMQDVAAQLPDDLYAAMPDEETPKSDDSDDIDDKLVDVDDEFDLDLSADHGDDDDFDLVEGGGPESILQNDGGLSYEDNPPPVDDLEPDVDFSSHLQREQVREKKPRDDEPDHDSALVDSELDDDSFLGEASDDPMLLLEEEIAMTKEKAGGGILGIAALVLGILGLLTAIFAAWQALSMQAQVSELNTLITNQPPPEPDPRIAVLETKLTGIDGKIASAEKKLTQTETALHDHKAQLSQLSDDSDTTQKLNALDDRVTKIDHKVTASDSKFTKAIDDLKQKQRNLLSRTQEAMKAATRRPQPVQQPVAKVEPPVTEQVTPAPVEEKPKPVITKKKKPIPPAQAEEWVVNLMSLARDRHAVNALNKLQKIGIFPRKRKVSKKGRTWYRLYVDGFGNKEAAQQYVLSIKNKPGLSRAWVSRAD